MAGVMLIVACWMEASAPGWRWWWRRRLPGSARAAGARPERRVRDEEPASRAHRGAGPTVSRDGWNATCRPARRGAATGLDLFQVPMQEPHDARPRECEVVQLVGVVHEVVEFAPTVGVLDVEPLRRAHCFVRRRVACGRRGLVVRPCLRRRE